jgi:uncharacterized protein (UPF0371 family)
MLLNALKALAGIKKDVYLISPEVIEPIQELKIQHLGNNNPRLHTDEVLIALSVCAVTDPNARLALDQLKKLFGCEMHSSVILSQVDEKLLKNCGGIVQGMSGSPIIQDGKLIGAVTHVLVNDPTRGYGIFIENMLDAAE